MSDGECICMNVSEGEMDDDVMWHIESGLKNRNLYLIFYEGWTFQTQPLQTQLELTKQLHRR